MKIIIYKQKNERSRKICEAMLNGVRSLGDKASIVNMTPDKIAPAADVAIFYGQTEGGRELLNSYVNAGKNVLYIDMGYWNRKTKKDVYGGYHKIALNDLHPTAHQLSFVVSGDRFDAHKIQVREKRERQGKHILLAGLSGKASSVNGLNPYEWELSIMEKIKTFTDRPIVYRPKPSWKEAKPIPGTIFSSRAQDLRDVLLDAHCVVTRHSNVTIDGMVEGIPGFTQLGAAKSICYSLDDLAQIESAQVSSIDKRLDFLHRLAYCQWNLEEMNNGSAWRWYRGLIA